MHKNTHGNNEDQIWESEILRMEVYTEGSDCSGNALFLKLGSGHMLLVILVIIHLYISEIFNAFQKVQLLNAGVSRHLGLKKNSILPACTCPNCLTMVRSNHSLNPIIHYGTGAHILHIG